MNRYAKRKIVPKFAVINETDEDENKTHYKKSSLDSTASTISDGSLKTINDTFDDMAFNLVRIREELQRELDEELKYQERVQRKEPPLPHRQTQKPIRKLQSHYHLQQHFNIDARFKEEGVALHSLFPSLHHQYDTYKSSCDSNEYTTTFYDSESDEYELYYDDD